MNILRSTLTAVSLYVCALGNAATPEEEARFLDALRSALTTKNQAELVALSCWDDVPADIKQMAIDGMVGVIADPIKSIQYQALGDAPITSRTLNGVVYISNLPITKQVKIEYDLKVGGSSATISVGEKDGKLMIVNLVPKK